MKDNKTLNEIKEKIGKATAILVHKYKIDFLIIFGSYASGKARLNSDIDIGFKGELDFNQELKLAGDLYDILESDHVDLVNLSKGSPLIVHQACRKAVLVFENKVGDFSDFRTLAFRKLVETQPLRDMNFARTLSYIKNYSPTPL